MSAAAEERGGLRVASSVMDAARWLAGGGAADGEAVVPQLRRDFGLSAKEAIDAIRAAQQLRRAR